MYARFTIFINHKKRGIKKKKKKKALKLTYLFFYARKM